MTTSKTLGTSTQNKNYIAVDTETYYEGTQKGLKSIQIYGMIDGEIYQEYMTASSYKMSDHLIRMELANKFFSFFEKLKNDTEVAFFNIDFDISQVLYYMTNKAGYNIKHIGDPKRFNLKKGEMMILESDRNMYMVMFRTKKHGRSIRMIDLFNFLPGSKLDSAAESWLGEHKVVVEDKKFPKRAPTDEEKIYGMKDAELTYKLFMELRNSNVIEGEKYVTIAGRTLGHFKDYLKSEFGVTLDEYFFMTSDKDEILRYKQECEEQLRTSTRGGMCMAVHKGVFEHCTHVDARSMYPTQCVRDFIPSGPVLKEPPITPYTYIVYPVGFFELKEGKLPYFQWRRKSQCVHYAYRTTYEPGEYVSDCILDGTYGVWEAEWEIIKENYNITMLEEDKKIYIEMRENIALKKYVQQLYEGKMNNTGSKRLYYKYLLNALYGKFLSRPDGVGIDYIDGKRVKVEENDRNTYYLPIGMWIAMMGRVTLFKAMSSIPVDNILYCDTDSIIFKGDVFPDIKIGKYLGEWSVEAEDVSVYIVGPKTYQELTKDGKLTTKCAGMPSDEIKKRKWLEIYEGYMIKCRKPRRDPVTWAINFEETQYEISTRAQIFRGRGL